MNGIMYAPNGTVAFNSNIANINGRIFADKINFSGSIFNVTSSDSDWELLGTKSVILKHILLMTISTREISTALDLMSLMN